MRKKFFSRVVVFVFIIFVLSLASVVGALAYNSHKVRALNASFEEIKGLLSSVETEGPTSIKEQPDFASNQRLFEQCYAEIIWQSEQLNLLYCVELEYPVIRAVANNNWNLIEDASIFNTTSREDLDVIEISPCAYGVTDFSYLPADDTTSEQENPPELGWIQISPNENGNYMLPLKEGEEIYGNYYTAFKYVIGGDTYYGMICLSTIF